MGCVVALTIHIIGHDSENACSFWRIWIPSIALPTIALAPVTLAATADLCPWKGGGSGMFATTDATAARHVSVFVEREGSSEEMTIVPSQKVDATRAWLFPPDRVLTRLALSVVARERNAERSVRSVRPEVWRTEFGNGSLEATNRLVRRSTYRRYESADHACRRSWPVEVCIAADGDRAVVASSGTVEPAADHYRAGRPCLGCAQDHAACRSVVCLGRLDGGAHPWGLAHTRQSSVRFGVLVPVALALGAPNLQRTLSTSISLLIVLVFGRAVVWKAGLSPDYLDGRFFCVTLLTDPRFEHSVLLSGDSRKNSSRTTANI
jgi:hypothetical protein